MIRYFALYEVVLTERIDTSCRFQNSSVGPVFSKSIFEQPLARIAIPALTKNASELTDNLSRSPQNLFEIRPASGRSNSLFGPSRKQ